jgi:hypothetical protein
LDIVAAKIAVTNTFLWKHYGSIESRATKAGGSLPVHIDTSNPSGFSLTISLDASTDNGFAPHAVADALHIMVGGPAKCVPGGVMKYRRKERRRRRDGDDRAMAKWHSDYGLPAGTR